MALTEFGFIITGDNFVQYLGTEKLKMKVVGVKNASEGIAAVKGTVTSGPQSVDSVYKLFAD